jgi:thioredoxin-related protein
MTTVCHFCKDSLPFYKDLAQLENTKPGQFQMVAVSPEETETTTKYLLENHVQFNRIESAPLESIDVQGTPTVFILDSTGTVRKVYFGKLQLAQQQELIAYVTKTT